MTTEAGSQANRLALGWKICFAPKGAVMLGGMLVASIETERELDMAHFCFSSSGRSKTAISGYKVTFYRLLSGSVGDDECYETRGEARAAVRAAVTEAARRSLLKGSGAEL